MAKSAEPNRKKAYSVDLRWRIVYQRIAINLPWKDIAKNLNIALSTAHRTYSIFERTGTVDPQERTTRMELRKLDRVQELYVIGLSWKTPPFTYMRSVKRLKNALAY